MRVTLERFISCHAVAAIFIIHRARERGARSSGSANLPAGLTSGGPRGVVAPPEARRRRGQAASDRGAASCAAGAHTWRMINEPTPDAEATFRRQPLDCSSRTPRSLPVRRAGSTACSPSPFPIRVSRKVRKVDEFSRPSNSASRPPTTPAGPGSSAGRPARGGALLTKGARSCT